MKTEFYNKKKGRKIQLKLILEGPDGGGKSTIGKKLSEELGLEIFHEGGAPDDRQEVLRRIGLLFNEDRQIFDRNTLISEVVYRMAFGEERRFNLDEMYFWLRELKKDTIPVFVYVRPSKETLLEAWNARQVKKHKSAEFCEKIDGNYGRIVDMYELLMSNIQSVGIPVLVYDRDETYSDEKLFEELKNYLESVCVE